MGLIAILDDNTINKIAAGEVVDRPASIVKELVENSIDAGATHISVEIKNGGISYIKISDNGKGIAADDVEIAFERHATSKIRKESDILKITSLGFRGEALASVASIAKVTMETKTKDEPTGTRIVIEGGKTLELEEIASNKGTTIIVENVFFNVPARYKFLKKDYTEAGYIEDVITRMAIIHPEISFKFVSNNKQIINTTGSGDIKLAVYNIFGKDIANELIPVEYEYKSMKVSGVIGSPKTSRSTRQYEFTYINGRYVKDKTLMAALEKAFEQNLNIGKFPFAILNLDLSPSEVDVNVHPAKLEVKFEHESDVFDTIYHGVTNALLDYHKKTSPFAVDIKPEYTSVPDVDVEKVVTNAVSTVEKTFETPVIPTFSVDNVDSKEEKTQEIAPVVETVEVSDETSTQVNTYTEPVLTREVEYVGKEGILEIKDIVDSVNEEEKKEYETKINYKYVGALFDTYILIEIEEKLYIIDQHAAHERLLYEQIKEMYYSKSKETQMLLIPSLVELKHNEQELVIRNKELFEETGFELEEFGDNMIKISGVPNIGYDMDYVELFKDTLDELRMESKTTKEEREERFLATIACKAAVKGNMKLTATEHVALIDKMVKLDRPFTCPHGRPTAYEISKYEIERRFARK
ncbi:MAG: DNA mismatch repair endonuclease MutL [Clostridia bacterium]|nr:DNA mismatch repair endonuclease MutL [Clostridia bacterium]MBR6641478.1 DNA mismatch repair endonuclease MutL [Clostridia bacterium]